MGGDAVRAGDPWGCGGSGAHCKKARERQGQSHTGDLGSGWGRQGLGAIHKGWDAERKQRLWSQSRGGWGKAKNADLCWEDLDTSTKVTRGLRNKSIAPGQSGHHHARARHLRVQEGSTSSLAVPHQQPQPICLDLLPNPPGTHRSWQGQGRAHTPCPARHTQRSRELWAEPGAWMRCPEAEVMDIPWLLGTTQQLSGPKAPGAGH